MAKKLSSFLCGVMALSASPWGWVASAHASEDMEVIESYRSLASALREPAATGYSAEEIRSVMDSTEQKVKSLRDQEIEQLRITIGRRLPKNRVADLYFRLAELYLEAYRAEFILEGRVFEKRKTDGRGDQFIQRGISKTYLQDAVNSSNQIIKLGIAYDKMDRVYYFLGVGNLELDRRKEAVTYFDALVKHYPSSTFASEAYKELGEASFDSKDYGSALRYFQAAVDRDQGDKTPILLHKLAWTYYRTRQFDRAVETMRRAIDLAQKGGEKFLNLREEALRDMAIFLVETGKVDEALRYFENVAGDKTYLPKVLERLGRQYERNVQPEKAIQVYEALLKARPEDEASFRVLVKLVDLDLRRGKTKEALARVQAAKIYRSGEADTETAYQNLRAMIRRTGTEAHENFRKEGAKPSLATAENFYTAYLTQFLAVDDPRKETPEIEMYLAEVKRELGKHKEASELYRKVLDSGDKRYAKEAGTLWTASLGESIQKATREGVKGREEPSEVEKEFIDAVDQMAKAVGETAEGREGSLRAAQVLAGYSKTQDDAIERCRKIIDRSPHTAQASVAARLWVQVLTDRMNEKKGAEKGGDEKDKAKLAEVLQQFSTNSELMAGDKELAQGKLAERIEDEQRRLRVGAIATAEKNKDYSQAARGYEDFAAQTKDQKQAEQAYQNAVSSYLKNGDFDSAERVVIKWLGRYKGSKVADGSIRSAATAALIQGKFDTAGGLFERLGELGGGAEAYETAARIFQGIDAIGRAREAWNAGLKKYPASNDRFSISLQLAISFESERKVEEAAKHFRLCERGPHEFQAECGARLGDLNLKYRDRAQAKLAYKAASNLKGKPLSPWVGYARYRLAELVEEEAKFEALEMPEAKLKKAVNQRISFLEPLSRAYESAVEVGGPWSVAALDRLASWVLKFTNELESVSPPATANPPTIVAFQKGISAIAEPLRVKALETWMKAYQNAVQQEILTPVMPQIADRLADAKLENPKGNFPFRAQGFRSKLRLAGVGADGGEAGRAGALEKVRGRLTRNAQDADAWVDYGNLLWGEAKPLLSRIAYDRAISLDAKNAAAYNNRAVVLISGSGEEDWSRVSEAQGLFEEARKKEEQFLPTQMNRAVLFNYYRLFGKSKPLWSQIVTRVAVPDAYDGLGISEQGQGQLNDAAASFAKATDLGGPEKRFARLFHEAGQMIQGGTQGASRCFKKLQDVDESSLAGFEREAFDRLRRTCRKWRVD